MVLRHTSLVFAVIAAAAAVFVAAPAIAGATVYTDPREVHACLPMGESGDVLAATRGGLVLVGANQHATAVWTSLDGLPATRTDALLRDGDDVWVGTEGGLARVQIDGDSLVVVETLASDPVRAIARHAGTLYIATWGGGVHRLEGDGLIEVAIAGDAAVERARVSDLESYGGTLYAATAGHGVFALVDGVLGPIGIELDDAIVWSLGIDGADLVIGTVDGAYRYDGTSARRVGSGDIRAIATFDSDVIVASFGAGFRRVDARVLRRADQLPGDELFAHSMAAIDRLGCIGAHDGLWIKRGTSSWKRAVLSGPPSNDITAVAADGDKLWVATFDRGLALLEAGAWRRIEHELLDPNINALAIAEGTLWIATSAGLTVIAGDEVTRISKPEGLPSRHVLSVTGLRDGGALVGTTRGAAIVRDGRADAIDGERGMNTANVWAVAEADDGLVWLGTTRGIYRGRPGGEWVRHSVSSGELRDDWVTAIALGENTAFVGTYKGGVVRFDVADGNTAATQLGDGWINPGGLTLVGNQLYASTMEGLFIGDGATPTWQKTVPAPGIDTTTVAATDHGLVVASRRGMVTFQKVARAPAVTDSVAPPTSNASM